jgi:hypothetical protein
MHPPAPEQQAQRGAPPAPIRTAKSRNMLATHEQFAQEAARAAQRYLDQVDEIESLIDDRDQWRNRALLSEGEIKRLELREGELIAKIDDKHTEVERERDSYKETLAIVGAQYNAASKILLDGFAAIRDLEKRLGPIVPKAPAAAEQVTAIEPHAYVPDFLHMGDCGVCGHLQDAPIHAMPACVTAGPRYDEKGIERDGARS